MINNMNDINFKLDGMTCEACVKLASNRLKKISGVREVKINLATGDTHILSETNLDRELLEKSLADTPYIIVK